MGSHNSVSGFQRMLAVQPAILQPPAVAQRVAASAVFTAGIGGRPAPAVELRGPRPGNGATHP